MGTGDDGSVEPDTARTEIDYLLGQEVGRRYRVVTPTEKREITVLTRGAAWNTTTNLVTITKYITSGTFLGYRQSVTRPGGTMSIFSYTNNADGTRTTTVMEGAPDGTGTSITDGRKLVTVIGSVGEVLNETVTDIASNIIVENRIYSNFDALRRAQRITHLGGFVEDTSYACCGVESQVDRDKVTTVFIYDAMGRRVAESRLNIITTNVLDAAGSVLVTRRIGTDGSTMLLRSMAYNTAGELTRETNGLGGITQYFEGKNGNGQLVRTNIFPDGGTRYETLYKDSMLQSITGSAVQPVAYTYAIELNAGSDYLSEYTRETKLDAAGAATLETVTDYVDLAGRQYKRVYAAASAPFPSETQLYNAKGQLARTVDPDGVTTLYEY